MNGWHQSLCLKGLRAPAWRDPDIILQIESRRCKSLLLLTKNKQLRCSWLNASAVIEQLRIGISNILHEYNWKQRLGLRKNYKATSEGHHSDLAASHRMTPKKHLLEGWNETLKTKQ